MLYKKVAYILIAIIASFALELTCMSSIPNGTESNLVGNVSELYPKYSPNFYGYDISGDRFIAINNDPQMLFTGINSVVGSLHIIFKFPLTQDTVIQVYYAEAGAKLSEANSTIITGEMGSTDVFLDLPVNEYSTLRVDINGGFTLSRIDISDCHVNRITVNKKLSLIRFLVILIIMIGLLILLYKTGYLKKVSYHSKCFVKDVRKSISKSKTRLLIRAITIIGIILLGAISEYTIAHVILPNSSFFNVYRFLFILTVYLIVFSFVILRKVIADKPEQLFLLISLITGSLFSFALPINTNISWDDQTHYYWAVEQSYFDSVRFTGADNFMINISLPKTFSIEEIEIQKDTINKEYNIGYISNLKKSPRSYLKIYSRVGHLPSAIFLFIGRALGLPFSIIFILGRWANLLVFSVVVCFAIKKLKSGKMIMSVIALFPTSLFLASNYSYDYWITCFIMLGMAYFISEIQQPNKPITLKETIIMIGSFVIGLGPKPIYFPVLLLPFLLEKRKFKSYIFYKKYRTALVLSILFVLASFMLPFIISGGGTGDLRGGLQVNPSNQVKFILSNPLKYSYILINFLKDYLSFDLSKDYMVFFAYLGYGKYHMLLLITLFIVVFTDKNEFDSKSNRLKIKLSIISVFFLSIILVATALYVSFTPVAQYTIAGVQPRYLIPLLFPLLSVIGSDKIINKINRTCYNSIVFGLCSFILLSGFWQACISKYY